MTSLSTDSPAMTFARELGRVALTAVVLVACCLLQAMEELHSDLDVKLQGGKISKGEWTQKLATGIDTYYNKILVRWQAYVFHDGPISIKGTFFETKQAAIVNSNMKHTHGKFVPALVSKHVNIKQSAYEIISAAEVNRAAILQKKALRITLTVLKAVKMGLEQLQ